MEAHNIITIVSRTIVAHLSDPGDIALLLNLKSRTDNNRKQVSLHSLLFLILGIH